MAGRDQRADYVGERSMMVSPVTAGSCVRLNLAFIKHFRLELQGRIVERQNQQMEAAQ
jgi:hypothetical protein